VRSCRDIAREMRRGDGGSGRVKEKEGEDSVKGRVAGARKGESM
jgi:hypothetical protein